MPPDTYLVARRDILGLARPRWVRTLRAQKADHYMLRVRMKIHWDQYAAPVRTLMGRGGEGSRSYAPRSTTRGTACLTWMCVLAGI